MAVFWKHCVFVFALVLLLCILSPSAAAQIGPGEPPGCYILADAHDLGIDMGNAVPWAAVLVGPNYVPGLGLLETYLLTTAVCPPPTPCHCDDTVGSPISVATGNTYIEQKDIRIPGLAGGLNLVRRWNSLWPSIQSAYQVGLFGPNWRSTFEEQVFVGSDNYVKYLRGDGSIWSFGYSSYGIYKVAAPQNVTATLTTPTAATPYTTITFQNGEQRHFDSTSGMLTAIIDRNGNTTTLTYDSASRLTTVTDAASRTLTFTYGSPSSHLVTGVSSSVGISLSYAYDTQSRLSQVTNPDLTTLTFAYNSQSLITSVTDTNGKVLESHTYDSNGRGLTSSRALSVDAVTLTYLNQ